MSDNIEIATRARELFVRGDIQAFVELCDENCVWINPGPNEMETAGRWVGKKGVLDYCSIVARKITVTKLEVDEIFEHRDMVVVIAKMATKYKNTGRSSESDLVQIIKIAGGKINFIQNYFDTASSLLAASDTFMAQSGKVLAHS